MQDQQPRHVTRRTAIGAALAALVAAVLTACGKGDTGGVKGPVAVGTVADVKQMLAEQQFVKNDAGQFYLLPAAPDAVIAVSWRCTHQGCMVNAPNPQFGQMKCPCHSSLFDAHAGTVVGGPAPRPLDWMPVTIENDTVSVDTSKVMTRRTFTADQTTLLP
jgi:Rieske Fe-S protein